MTSLRDSASCARAVAIIICELSKARTKSSRVPSITQRSAMSDVEYVMRSYYSSAHNHAAAAAAAASSSKNRF